MAAAAPAAKSSLFARIALSGEFRDLDRLDSFGMKSSMPNCPIIEPGDARFCSIVL
jgi:hypothetical protein